MPAPRSLAYFALSLALSLALAACGGATSAAPDDTAAAAVDARADGTAPDADDARDAAPPAADVPAAAPDVAAADEGGGPQGPCPADCPAALCQEVSGRCLACVATDDCLRGEWCRDGACVRTLCVPGDAVCEGFDRKTCAADGERYAAPEPCPDDERCTGGDCLPVVCAPGETRCAELQLEECNPAGTGWSRSQCQPGAVCRGEEGCVPFKNTLLLVFDTSGSMGEPPMGMNIGQPVCICPDDPANPNDGCPKLAYPACEKPLCPRTKLGLAKYIFTQIFSIISTRDLHFVMTRFPQQVTRSAGDCTDMFGVGHYQIGIDVQHDFMSLDDGAHVTEDGGWYDQQLDQILCVGYPRTDDEDTFAEARRWMDFDEQVGPTFEPCVIDDDCRAGWCDTDPASGDRVCYRHSNPELRGISGTPLGHSLFYAAEYIRKYVAPEGKACATDADCNNVDYHCGPDGTCFDPLAHCRSVTVVLFTDGLEDPATSPSDFFNPRVQAKRMRYGLSCEVDTDCGEGAVCSGHVCDGYPRPNGSAGSPPHPFDPEPKRLYTYSERPLQVVTHVIDFGDGQGATTNRLIADDGGGRFFGVGADNPQAFIDALLNVTDIKQSLVCTPRFPPGYVPAE